MADLPEVEKIFENVRSFRYNTRTCRTDGRTDGQTDTSPRHRPLCVARQKRQKTQIFDQ